jgi:hypothetical protein
MAKQTIPCARERMVISKLLLGLWRELIRHLPEWYETAGAEAYLISSCVVIGHAEKRPMTASNIASYSDLPRTTVLRKLNLMMMAGIIERKGHQYCLHASVIGRHQHIAPIRKLLISAASDLSKLDKDAPSRL